MGEKLSAVLPTVTPLLRSFTCRKSATWDRRLYSPSEGRHAEDFFRPEKSDGFGRFRTRELGYQRPAWLPLDHRRLMALGILSEIKFSYTKQRIYFKYGSDGHSIFYKNYHEH
jgi:hypothetical protein